MSRDTGRSRPSDLLVDEDEGVSVLQLPRGTPVYRNDRRVTLGRSGQGGSPPWVAEPRFEGPHQGIEVGGDHGVGRIGERERERLVRFVKEARNLPLVDFSPVSEAGELEVRPDRPDGSVRR